MKRLIFLLLAFMMLLGLCACGESETVPPTTTAAPTTVQTEPVCVHQYAAADCVTPKTCTICGQTRGSALGHDYAEGTCTRCGEADPTYRPLLGSEWRIDCLHTDGSQLELVSLIFNADGTADFSAGIYDRLSDIPEEERSDYMSDEEYWYDYSGEIYCYAGFGVYSPLVYTVEGDIITCTLSYNEESVLILERTAGNMLTVTYYEGNFSIYYLQVGDVLSCEG